MEGTTSYYMKVTEAAELLDVNRSTIHRLIQDGKLPSVRLGEKIVRIPRAAFEAYLRAGGSGRTDEAITPEPVRVAYTPVPDDVAGLREAANRFMEKSGYDPFSFVAGWRDGSVEDTAENSELAIEALSLRSAMIGAGLEPVSA